MRVCSLNLSSYLQLASQHPNSKHQLQRDNERPDAAAFHSTRRMKPVAAAALWGAVAAGLARLAGDLCVGQDDATAGCAALQQRGQLPHMLQPELPGHCSSAARAYWKSRCSLVLQVLCVQGSTEAGNAGKAATWGPGQPTWCRNALWMAPAYGISDMTPRPACRGAAATAKRPKAGELLRAAWLRGGGLPGG